LKHASELILLGAFLMLISVLAGQLSKRLGAPVLLAFLGVGIFFGENGPGGIVFNDNRSAFFISTLALAIILFDGGLRTNIHAFKLALKPALLLSTIGVLVTGTLTGLFAAWLMEISLLQGMLLGSVVASTDAAAVFLLLYQRGLRLKERVRATLEVESGMNDPMAVFLTITCVSLLSSEAVSSDWWPIAELFIKQMGLGLIIGYAGGMGLLYLLRHARLDIGLYPVVVLTGGLFIFGCANIVDGSGFLAVYLAGVTFANGGHQKLMLIKQFNDGMAWIAQLVMLLTLGLLVTPKQLVVYMVPAVFIAIFLIVVARPLAVWCCLPGRTFTWREKTFISWVGLRGAIPIYLALIPALSAIENGQAFFNIAFIIVVASLVLQGWAINPLARKLRIVDNTGRA
jgi:potassium/hydrogen antiporter